MSRFTWGFISSTSQWRHRNFESVWLRASHLFGSWFCRTSRMMPWNTHRITSETTREFRNPLLGLFMAWKKINTMMYWHSKSIIHVDAAPVSAWANLVGRWKAATGSMFVLSGLQPMGVFERVSIHGTWSPQACIFLFMSGWPNWCQLSRSLGAVHTLKTFILVM